MKAGNLFLLRNKLQPLFVSAIKLSFALYLFLIFFSPDLHALNQKKIDSLLTVIGRAKENPDKVNALRRLSWELRRSRPEAALRYAMQGLSLAEKIHYKKGTPGCLLNMGNIFKSRGKYDTSLVYYSKAVAICEELLALPENTNDEILLTDLASGYNNIGIIHLDRGNYPVAIGFYQKGLKLREKINDRGGLSGSYVNIGNVHYMQGDYLKAIEYYSSALKVAAEVKDKFNIASCFNNIGLCYSDLKNYGNAQVYFQKTLDLSIEIGDRSGIAGCYCNLGLTCYYLSDLDKAAMHYEKARIIWEELGDKKALAGLMAEIAALHMKQKNYRQVLETAMKGLQISREIQSLPDERRALSLLSGAYKNTGDFEKALNYHELFKSINDSIFNTEKSKQLSRMESIYQSEKKQKEIELLNKDKQLQQTEIAKQTTQKYAFIAGFMLMLLLAAVVYRSYRQKKKANILLAKQKLEIEEKNEELHQQNEEIRTQRDEIEAQRDEISAQRDTVTEQKKHIEQIHTELTDSIRYAERIQKALLPEIQQVEMRNSASLLELFILYRPKDIVSGDFYLIEKKNNMLITCVADCTGHGVPGAFMSMLGISFLNEILAKKENLSPGNILDGLRGYMINSLQQKGVPGEQKDGMDIALCMINTETLEMQFAGANNPVWVVPSCHASTELSTGGMTIQLEELRPDKMPIGIHDRMDPFTNHTHQLQKGDVIYLMSDGFEDQFGGPHRKKFFAKNLKNLLLANCQLSMTNQKQILETTITEWIGSGEQIDDITVMGIKI